MLVTPEGAMIKHCSSAGISKDKRNHVGFNYNQPFLKYTLIVYDTSLLICLLENNMY